MAMLSAHPSLFAAQATKAAAQLGKSGDYVKAKVVTPGAAPGCVSPLEDPKALFYRLLEDTDRGLHTVSLAVRFRASMGTR